MIIKNIEYTDTDCLRDLAKAIAQQTCGMITAMPEQDDFDLAKEFIKVIDERYDR